MLDESFSIAEGNGNGHELEGVDELCTGRTAALDFERNHAAKVLHLLCGDVVTDMSLETGIVDFFNCRVAIQEFGDHFRIGAVLLHTDLKGLETAENKKCAERIHNCTGHVLKAEHTNLADKLG